jgi:hypothetical protein
MVSQTEEALGWTAEGQKFAKANPVDIKAPEGLSLKSVPSFDRPMSAGPNDEWTGRQDELGNREYKSQLDGSTYFIKPDADQRTELEKIQQDIIPVVRNYLDNPTAPSREQTIEFLKSAVGDAWETVSIPADLVSGKKGLSDVSLGQLFEIGGSAAVSSLPMNVPEGSMRTFGGSNPPTYVKRDAPFIEGQEPGYKIDNPLDPESTQRIVKDELGELRSLDFIMFREPIAEFAETVDIPKKGLLGSEFLTLIKKNDSIPETSLQEGIIEPGKRYTKEELLGSLGVGRNTLGTFISVANIAADKPKQFEGFQRQGKHAGFEGGQEVEYFDIPIETSIGFPGKKFKANEQHYDSDTLVHVRGSIIDPKGSNRENQDFLLTIEGEDYLLVEEIQSDLLTKGFVRPKNKFDADFSNATDDYSRSAQVSYEEAFGSIDKEIKSIIKELEIDIDKYTADLIDNILQDGPIGSALITPKQSTALENYYKLVQKKVTDKKIDAEIDPLDMASIYQSYLINKNIIDGYQNPNDIGLPPIRKNKQAVDEALKILIAKAAQSGVTKIVIPPAERIALARGRKLKEDKGDRFYRTYVTDLEKSLIELQDNYPVKIYEEQLPYKRHEDFVGFVPEEMADNDILQDAMTDLLDDQLGITNTLSNTSTSKIGTIIDITDLVNKYKVEKPRQFAQGGVVNDMNRQMKMFATGGLNDDGMQRDPVSGNEIPPGSLAKEVRDDIPAQLSEGEYVVPADVVRFFGVNHFEDLRNKAKSGLSQMDKNGRIGGEPVAENKPLELPFKDEELQVRQPAAKPQAKMAGTSMNTVKPRIGMAKGGYVGTSMEAVRMRNGGVVKGYAEGGLAIPAETPRGASNLFAGRSNLFQGYGGAGRGGALEVRTYVNAAGDTLLIPFLNGKIFNGLVIPDGFYLEGSPEATFADEGTQKVTQDASGEVDNSDGNVNLNESKVTVKSITAPEDLDKSKSLFGVNQDFFALSPEDLGTYGEDFGSTGDMMRYAGLAAMLIPGAAVLGAIAGIGRQVTHANDIANIRAAAQVATMRGYTDQAILLNARADKMVKDGGFLAKAMDKTGGLSGESIANKVIKSYTTIYDYGSKGDPEGLTRDMFNTDDAWNATLQRNAPEGYNWVPEAADDLEGTGSYQVDPNAETVSIPTADGNTIEVSIAGFLTDDGKPPTGITKLDSDDDVFAYQVDKGSAIKVKARPDDIAQLFDKNGSPVNSDGTPRVVSNNTTSNNTTSNDTTSIEDLRQEGTSTLKVNTGNKAIIVSSNNNDSNNDDSSNWEKVVNPGTNAITRRWKR